MNIFSGRNPNLPEGLENWLDRLLRQEIPPDTAAVCFNLYEDGENRWSLEAVACSAFDWENSDWACEELTDFGTREKPFIWQEDSGWEKVLDKTEQGLKVWLSRGKARKQLHKLQGVGLGFAEGDLRLLDKA